MVTKCSLETNEVCIILSITVNETTYDYHIDSSLYNATHSVYQSVNRLKGQLLDICNIDETGFDFKAGTTHIMFEI